MTEIRVISEALLAALRSGEPIPPPTDSNPGLTVEDAYAIQRAGLDQLRRDGATVVGHKVGLTSAAMQEMLGVAQPDFGYLTAAMVSDSGCLLAAGDFIAARVELEIAFRLGRPLGGDSLQVDDVLDATMAVAPAIEVIDSRIADWRITIADTVADNASSGHVVLGSWRPVGELDLARLRSELTVEHAGGEVTTVSGDGAAVLGHPATAVAWLARALDEYGDEEIGAGEVVLSGAMSRALEVGPGSSVSGQVEDLGAVSVTFTSSASDGYPRG